MERRNLCSANATSVRGSLTAVRQPNLERDEGARAGSESNVPVNYLMKSAVGAQGCLMRMRKIDDRERR